MVLQEALWSRGSGGQCGGQGRYLLPDEESGLKLNPSLLPGRRGEVRYTSGRLVDSVVERLEVHP